jgi:hypothetical protein
MNSSILPKIAFFWLTLFCVFGLFRSAPAALPALPAPAKIELEGHSYQILKDPALNVVRVQTDSFAGPVREELLLKIKRDHLPPWHVHLRLSSTTPQSMTYTGILPSKIQWQGSLTFELSPRRLRP